MRQTGKHVHGMSAAELTFHWCMNIATLGVWYFLVYKPRKYHCDRTEKIYER